MSTPPASDAASFAPVPAPARVAAREHIQPDSAPSLRALEVSRPPGPSDSDPPDDSELADEFGADRTPAGILVDRATLAGSRPRKRRAFPLLSVAAVAAFGATLWWTTKSVPEPAVVAAAAPEPAVAAAAAPEPAAPEPAAPVPEPAAAPEPATAGSKVAYDEQRLDFALRWARTHAERCHQGGRAVGTAQLAITIAPDGKVSAFQLTGEPIAGAPVATCVATYFQSMLIPAFDGPAFTIHETLTLR